MAEAEDVLTDIARHATVYARDLWQRHRRPEPGADLLLTDITHRLDLFVLSTTGQNFLIRPAQPPTHPTLLARVFRHTQSPWCLQAIPATDGHHLWLPPHLPLTTDNMAAQLFRTLALQQATRAMRYNVNLLHQLPNPVVRDIFLLVEAYAVDEIIIGEFPGMRPAINQLRQVSLQARPPLSRFSMARQPLENFYQNILKHPCGSAEKFLPIAESPAQSLLIANKLLPALMTTANYSMQTYSSAPLLKDLWTGEFRLPEAETPIEVLQATEDITSQHRPQSARLPRRPQRRQATEDEDKKRKKNDAWMVQGDESHPKAEDPMGLQRPVDQEDTKKADEYADLVSELSEARLISTPGQSREVLLSDDPQEKRSRLLSSMTTTAVSELIYPEWDYLKTLYCVPGAKVLVVQMEGGSQQWVDDILLQHQLLIRNIRRQFELLRAQRVLQHQQLDGEELDLDAYITSYTDFRAGGIFNQAIYQTQRALKKNVAIMLLVDISGSTDSWIANNKRIIDVEREALLLVTIALQSLGEPYSVLAFSGEGMQAVRIWDIKHHTESFSNEIALRISALQPERYTRSGTALRHATAELMKVAATHRLLIVLSDGKPNDNDHYEGRYGIEDTRQAVQEAKNQGVRAFCLTVDRQAANYLPYIFGTHDYALLPRPEQLPPVLVEWMKRLLIT
ncbi:nitric oxide reductase activation protein NorD [Cellvibrio sp. PSBB006]|uniref:nitric oxide reductase activation protein NorD n=1 Tax=Cellvibrio sp. PSBB006 TaxID=1987723 RepID=UPI000B3B9789|nr:VWA domain-containing protein [Cellvibrio sp. PSBB006]ARU26127.1 hypothetical protein CBR65_01035 [Cellvibrio sp. PSBB006]